MIHTKLLIPRVRAGLIERPRLLSQLDDCVDRRLVLISAPPGFGKTTLAVDWLERRSPRATWITLDSLDSEPERFAKYLVAALQRVQPESCRRSAALLTSYTATPWSYFVETLVTEIAALDEPLWIVLDDFYRVSSAPVHELVQRLVQQLPEALHLLILTRVDPPWPLGGWRVQGWLAELRAHDLRFSPEEARAFFAADPRLPLADADVDLLQKKTEGWPAGLRLAQISLIGAADPGQRAREFSGSDRLIVDYLMQEVLATQPPEVRTFWSVTARLERYCAGLCDHLLANRDPAVQSHEILARLEHHNLFLVPLDAEHRWFRYHLLFQELLLSSLEELSSPELAAEVARRAAEWFEREGLIEEALKHWIDAGDLDAAADLVGRHLRTAIDEDLSRRTLARWLAWFPPEAERGRLPLLLAHGFLKIVHWDLAGLGLLLDEAEKLLADSGEALSEERRKAFRADLATQRSYLLYWQGDAEGTLHYASRALADLPKRGVGMSWGLATMYQAGGLILAGRRNEALHGLERELEEDAAAGSPHAGELLTTQAMIHLYAADLAAVRERALRMLAIHETVPIPDYWAGYADYFLAVVAYERNLLEEAEEHFRRVEGLRYLVNSRLYQDALIGLGLVAAARGDAPRAAAWAAAARAYALEAGDPTSIRYANSFDVRLGLAAAAPPAEEAALPSLVDSMSIWLEVPTLTYAERLIEECGAAEARLALAFLDAAMERAEKHRNERQAIRLELLMALALEHAGEQREALKRLSGALRRAESGGFVRLFLDRGPRLRNLLEALARKRAGDRYLDTLLAAFGAARTGEGDRPAAAAVTAAEAAEMAPPPESWQVLTHRELDVLELLARRLSNKEVAARLSVTSETVKKHAFSIYRKLGAHGRREAVARALASGLIRPQ